MNPEQCFQQQEQPPSDFFFRENIECVLAPLHDDLQLKSLKRKRPDELDFLSRTKRHQNIEGEDDGQAQEGLDISQLDSINSEGLKKIPGGEKEDRASVLAHLYPAVEPGSPIELNFIQEVSPQSPEIMVHPCYYLRHDHKTRKTSFLKFEVSDFSPIFALMLFVTLKDSEFIPVATIVLSRDKKKNNKHIWIADLDQVSKKTTKKRWVQLMGFQLYCETKDGSKWTSQEFDIPGCDRRRKEPVRRLEFHRLNLQW